MNLPTPEAINYQQHFRKLRKHLFKLLEFWLAQSCSGEKQVITAVVSSLSYPEDISLLLLHPLVLRFFLPPPWYPSSEPYQRVSVLIKIPHLGLYLSSSGVISAHICSGSYYRHRPRMHRWQQALPPALCSCSIDRFSFSQLAAKATVVYLELGSLANGSNSFMESPLSKFTRQLPFGYQSSRHFANTNSNIVF